MNIPANSRMLLIVMTAALLGAAGTGCVEHRVTYVPVYQSAPVAVVQAPPGPPAFPVTPSAQSAPAPTDAFAPSPTAAPAPVVVAQVPPPAPAPIIEVVPVAPSPEFVWVPGFWTWQGHWVWMGGVWTSRPRVGVVWNNGRWARHGHGWIWVGGHWR